MFAFLSSFFHENKIDCFSALPLSAARIVRPYLLEQAGISDGTVIPFCVPYYTPASDAPDRNLSAYAVSKDYHLFFKEFFDKLIPLLKENFPPYKFAGFADHSPIDEWHAAASAGLGIIGKNHLLITEKYSSYVFLGELITDAVLPSAVHEIGTCENCGACMKVCPAKACGECLSALTQKKGELTEEEKARLLSFGSVWGCDLCQEVCPHTEKAIREKSIYSKIPFFYESPVSHLTLDILDNMNDGEFSSRAFAWRKRDTIRRNLLLMETKPQRKEN